jgi:hypothetical protein
MARDPVIRAAMSRIARDETRHAALAYSVDSWARGRMDKDARRRVAATRRRAFDGLAAGLEEMPAALRTPIGLPTRAQTLSLMGQMAELAA